MSSKKRPITVFLIFIFAMALVTYFSRMIYINSLPGVEIGYLKGGRLYNLITPDSFELTSDEETALRVDPEFNELALYIDSVDVGVCERVTKGQTIVSFDEKHGELMLEKAKRSLLEAQGALDDWDAQHEKNIETMENDLEEGIAALSYSSDIDREAKRLRKLRDELQALREEDISENRERLALAAGLESTADKVGALESLAADDWKLLADEDGIVSEICVAKDSFYGGVLPICRIIPIEAQFKVRFCVSDVPDMDSTASVDIQIGDKTRKEWTWETRDGNGKNAVLTFSVSDPALLKDIAGARVLFTSNMYQFVIPNSALDGETAYVLNERESAFGGSERYVTAVTLANAPADNVNTAVTGALNGSDQIVLSWDRPIGDGDVVNVNN